MSKPVLVVMAAGMGSRYGGLKQIDPVGNHNQLIIDYSIYDARRAGFETVVFVIKHEIEEAFKAAIGEIAVLLGIGVCHYPSGVLIALRHLGSALGVDRKTVPVCVKISSIGVGAQGVPAAQAIHIKDLAHRIPEIPFSSVLALMVK